MAKALHDALAITKTPGETKNAAGSEQPKLDIDTTQIDQALGKKGKNDNGIYKVEFPRAETITEHGMQVSSSMGLTTTINFEPTGSGKSAITGDFVLLGKEVNPVIRALRDNGIEVTAVHSHMLTEIPRLFFLHYWANADSAKLARGLRAALGRL